MKPAVNLERVTKLFKRKAITEEVIHDFSLKLEPGKWLSICGRSGVGKTTLLRIIGGLEEPDSGIVTLFGEKPNHHYPRIGYVVQDYNSSLLPWRDVLSNVSFPLLNLEGNRALRKERAQRALERVGLEDSLTKLPWQLSGGMRQRVALARALVVEPVLLLLDEPFTSLDTQNREQLRSMVKKISIEDSITTVFVTHDLEEAIGTADEVLMFGGSNESSIMKSVDLDAKLPISTLKRNPEFQSLYDDLAIAMQFNSHRS